MPLQLQPCLTDGLFPQIRGPAESRSRPAKTWRCQVLPRYHRISEKFHQNTPSRQRPAAAHLLSLHSIPQDGKRRDPTCTIWRCPHGPPPTGRAQLAPALLDSSAAPLPVCVCPAWVVAGGLVASASARPDEILNPEARGGMACGCGGGGLRYGGARDGLGRGPPPQRRYSSVARSRRVRRRQGGVNALF